MYDVIIVGSGPAGYTAALYASRALLKTLILSGHEPGGQLITTTEVENFPGFPSGIQGPMLMEEMKKQVERFGTELQQLSALSLQRSDRKTFVVKTELKAYEGKAVIIATGASAQYLGLPSEERLKGKGVSACATCDGFFFRGKEVVVIGGGDTAMEEATFLTTFATKVTVIHRRDVFRASPIMLKKAQENPKISFITNGVVEEILGDATVSGIRLKDTRTGKTSQLATQGVFLAIGHTPNTAFLKGFVEMDEKGYIVIKSQITNHKSQTISNTQSSNVQNQDTNPKLLPQTQTSVEGVFAAGDCVDPRYRQAIVAAGMGCMAAMDAQHWLTDHR